MPLRIKESVRRDIQDLEYGQTLTGEQADQLEELLLSKPLNVRARLNLIGYYRRNRAGNAKARIKHILWMIDNCSQRKVWRERILMRLEKDFDSTLFTTARNHWLQQINQFTGDADVLGNAGLFFIERDFETGKRLLSKAMKLQPHEDCWPGELSQFCFYRAGESDNLRRHFAKEALKTGERFLKLYGSEGGRGTCAVRAHGLALCARCAFWINDLRKAKRYAMQHVNLVSRWREGPKSGHSMLGLVAIQEGQTEQAKTCLLHINAQSRPDDLDLQLANELINVGEFAVVIEYLQRCKQLSIWKHRDLDKWISDLSKKRKIVLS
jgi:hypothetical protein